MKRKSLSINAVLNTLKMVLGYIFPLITIPYITRVLQVEAVGVVNFSNSIISYFVLIAGLGVGTYAIREGTQYRDNRSSISQFVSEVFSINVYSTIVSYILLFLTIAVVPKLKDYAFAIIILSVEIIFTTIGVNWVCNIYEDFVFIAIQSIGVQAISLLFTLIFVKAPSDLYKYIAIVAFSKSASNIINFIYIRIKYCRFKFLIHFNLKNHIKPILIMFSTSVAMTIYVSSDTTMIGFILSDYQVGLYSTAVKIYQIVKNVLAAVLTVLIPRFAILIKENDKNAICRLFSKVFNLLSIMIFPATVGLIITSTDVVRLVAGINYVEGSDSLRLLCVAISFSLVATLYASCILIPNRMEGIVFKATVISAVVNILLNILLIPLWGINGAAITTIIAEAIVCVIAIRGARRNVKLNQVGRNLFSVGMGCVGIIITGVLGQYYIEQYLFRLGITVFVGAFTYLLILVLMRNQIILECINRIKSR